MKNLILMMGVVFTISSCTVSQTYQITGQPIGTKTGVAKSKIIGDSDTSIRTAAENGKIKVIGAVQMTTKVFFIPFTKTIVYGE
jgi:hypothetical protein